jgi:hypothetical protein
MKMKTLILAAALALAFASPALAWDDDNWAAQQQLLAQQQFNNQMMLQQQMMQQQQAARQQMQFNWGARCMAQGYQNCY